MKTKYFFKAIVALGILLPVLSNAQISTFDDLTLSAESYWNGSDLNGGFVSGSAYFFNNYDTTYSSWNSFSYSDITDDTTAGWANQYSAFTGGGANGSSNYAVGNVTLNWLSGTYNPIPISVKLQEPLAGSIIKGVFVTNSTYAALSMRNGDNYAKKFGGDSGNDPDWFLLIIRGYNQGIFTDSVNFYLADYRFADNSQDYIIDYWAYINLTILGSVDSLTFSLRSSDVGSYGMNTPAFFCIDNLNDIDNGIADNFTFDTKAYPNPVQNILNLEGVRNAKIGVSTLTGKIIYSVDSHYDKIRIDLSEYPAGMYFATIQKQGKSVTKKIIKQ